ncbi:hypothetical protein P5658_25725 (plasmid) [Bacillus subtilis]|uniref:Uncharacterized protein n=1 Tax=Bacillus subtilis TaxID=1423 RepID=A0AC61Z6F1_BACIU|nr:hypothetical protein [Bacillus subtilis]WGD66108.1 hypothetical protein P5652_22680 [Bacillus subtilis]WGE04232.1 hypothetical protein P5640_00150 [Bacillus subtilis]WGE08894.1 hypothetical protein P5658_25765 [Bacillus subtilis]
MKTKFLFIILSTLIIMLTGCKSEKEEKKEKYDSSINQVVTLENKRLQKEKILTDTDILKREDIGIAVYQNGDFIELIYELKPNKQTESLYKKDKSKNYKLFPKQKIKRGDVNKELEKIDYVENTALK